MIRLPSGGRLESLGELCLFSRLGGLLVDKKTGQEIMVWPLGRDITDGEMITRQSLADCLFVLKKYIKI